MIPKDKKIIEDSEREGIPIFVLTAKDVFSTETIVDYFKSCLVGGCDSSHLAGITGRIEEFKEWQNSNRQKLKTPD